MVDEYYTIDEIDDVDEYNVWVLPFRPDMSFPQKFYVRLVNDIFIVRYRINSFDGSFMMEIRRSIDEVVLFLGKIVEGYEIGIKTPETGIVDYGLFPKQLSRERMEVWLIPLDEMFTEAP